MAGKQNDTRSPEGMLSSAVEVLFRQNMVVTSLKIKYPGIDPLMVVCCKSTEGPKIAFIGGATIADIAKAFHTMVIAEAVKWREDEWEMRRLAGNLPDG